jgi:hypothetical protein
MFELIYRSIAVPNISDKEINAILKTSRKFNSENNITGCLLFHNNEFIQILEGDEKTIKKLYARIEKDNRHTEVRLVYTGIKEGRTFEGWSMAFSAPSENDVNNINGSLFIENIKTIAELAEDRSDAVKLFWYMAKQLIKEI